MAASPLISFCRYVVRSLFCIAFLLLIYLIGSQMLDLVGNFGLSLGLSAQSTRIAAGVCGAVFLVLCLLVLLHFLSKDD
jgi:hypothetical protein